LKYFFLFFFFSSASCLDETDQRLVDNTQKAGDGLDLNLLELLQLPLGQLDLFCRFAGLVLMLLAGTHHHCIGPFFCRPAKKKTSTNFKHIEFLNQKAKIFGMEKLGWQDVDAPVALGDVKPPRFTYDEACDFVIENFAKFGPKLSVFAKNALENRWVEAEDRPNKRPGGYCTGLPEFEESRIFSRSRT